MNARVAHFMERLLTEFPEWSNETALHTAQRIIEVGEQMAFQMDVERDLAALPLTTERRTA